MKNSSCCAELSQTRLVWLRLLARLKVVWQYLVVLVELPSDIGDAWVAYSERDLIRRNVAGYLVLALGALVLRWLCS